MPEARLDRPRVVAVVGELIAAGMAEHVGVRLDAEIGGNGCPLYHAGEAWRRQRRTALRDKHKRGLGAFPLMAAELAHFAPAQRVRGRGAILGPADVQGCGFEVDLPQRRSTTSAALRPCVVTLCALAVSMCEIESSFRRSCLTTVCPQRVRGCLMMTEGHSVGRRSSP
jgi:hypothetical protein